MQFSALSVAQEQKQRCEVYQEKVDICKKLYAEALRNLEHISNGIHTRREEARIRAEMGSRGCGVGAEESSPVGMLEATREVQLVLDMGDELPLPDQPLSPPQLPSALSQRPPRAPRPVAAAEGSVATAVTSSASRRRHVAKTATPLVGFLQETMALNAHQYVPQTSLRQSAVRPHSTSPTVFRKRADSLPFPANKVERGTRVFGH